MAININLKTTNIELGDGMKNHLAKQLNKLDKYIDDDDTSAIADIELEKRSGQQSGNIYRAEINVKIAGSHLRVEENASDIRNAIDLVQEEMIRRLRDTKDKRRSRIRDGARKMKQMIQGWYGADGEERGNSDQDSV